MNINNLSLIKIEPELLKNNSLWKAVTKDVFKCNLSNNQLKFVPLWNNIEKLSK